MIAPYIPVADMIAAPDGLTERETIEQCLFGSDSVSTLKERVSLTMHMDRTVILRC